MRPRRLSWHSAHDPFIVREVLFDSEPGQRRGHLVPASFIRCKADRAPYCDNVRMRVQYSGENWHYCTWRDDEHPAVQCERDGLREHDFCPSLPTYVPADRDDSPKWSTDARTREVIHAIQKTAASLTDERGAVGLAAKAYVTGEGIEEAHKAARCQMMRHPINGDQFCAWQYKLAYAVARRVRRP